MTKLPQRQAAICATCRQHLDDVQQLSFLGFPRITCPHCGTTSTYPLATSRATTYAWLFVIFVFGVVGWLLLYPLGKHLYLRRRYHRLYQQMTSRQRLEGPVPMLPPLSGPTEQVLPGKRTATRACLACGYDGEMKTWLGNYNVPQILVVLLFFVYILPAILFFMWTRGKYRCPNCRRVAEGAPSARREAVQQA